MTATRAALEESLHEEETGSTWRRERQFLPPGKAALLRAATGGKGTSGTRTGKAVFLPVRGNTFSLCQSCSKQSGLPQEGASSLSLEACKQKLETVSAGCGAGL